MNTTLTMNLQIGCRLLCLPPEIRGRIFAYALEKQAPQLWLGDAVEKKPDKSLLLTCQYIQAELKKMYTKVYRDYWTNTIFIVCPSRSGNAPNFDWIEDGDLKHITCIRTITSQRER